MGDASPDPAAIRLEVLARMLAERDGWTPTEGGWGIGPFELVTRSAPGLSYEVWRGPRCIAAAMLPRDAIAICECLAQAARERPSSPQRLFDSLAIPLVHHTA
jgi:hypothetical protein